MERRLVVNNVRLVMVADEMLDSKWHKQTTKRCERLAVEFRES